MCHLPGSSLTSHGWVAVVSATHPPWCHPRPSHPTGPLRGGARGHRPHRLRLCTELGTNLRSSSSLQAAPNLEGSWRGPGGARIAPASLPDALTAARGCTGAGSLGGNSQLWVCPEKPEAPAARSCGPHATPPAPWRTPTPPELWQCWPSRGPALFKATWVWG